MVTVRELSRRDARRLAVRAQLLDRPRPTGLLDVVRQLTLLQIDPVAAIAPNADLVAWSRLGSSYSPAELDTALADRALLELRAMIRPSEDLALYRADMAAGSGPSAENCPAGGRPTATGYGPTTHAGWTSWTGLAPLGRCRRAIFRTPARCRGGRPGGPTTATSRNCWSSWCCEARSRSPGAGAATGCGTWRGGSTPMTRWSPGMRRCGSATSGGCGLWASRAPGDRNVRSSRRTWARRASRLWWRGSRARGESILPGWTSRSRGVRRCCPPSTG